MCSGLLHMLDECTSSVAMASVKRYLWCMLHVAIIADNLQPNTCRQHPMNCNPFVGYAIRGLVLLRVSESSGNWPLLSWPKLASRIVTCLMSHGQSRHMLSVTSTL